MAGTVSTLDRVHPVGVAAARVDDILKGVRDLPLWSMGPAETRDLLVGLTRLEAQVVELQARVAAHAEGVEIEADCGASSTASWWADATRQTRAGAHRRTKLAAALTSQRHDPVRVALADGGLLVDQAEVIISAVEALPEDLDPEIVAGADDVAGVRRDPRRQSTADPGETDPRGGRPRDR